MTAARVPRTTEAAAALMANWAELDTKRAAAEAVRQAELGRINAAADAEIATLIDEQDLIRSKLEQWFGNAGKALLPKGRKSMQLGGCTFGSRSSSVLEHGFDTDDKAVEALKATRFAKLTLRVRHTIDRVATKKLLQIEGKAKQALGELGFRLRSGDHFFLERVEQGGTIAPTN